MNHPPQLVLMLLLAAGSCRAQPAATSAAAATGPLFRPASAAAVALGGAPAHFAVGDFNGDRKPDIAAALGEGDAVAVLLGDGRGGLRPAAGSPFAAGEAPHLLALGDFDGDGKLDAAASSHDSNAVVVLLGDGTGALRPAPGSPFTAVTEVHPHNHGLIAADLDGDRALDLATSNQDGHSVAVLRGDGRGGFRPAAGSPFAVGRGPYPLAVGDVNGDGRLDLATPDVRSDTVTVLLGQGEGGFVPAPGSPHRVVARPYFVHLGDLDGDGVLDLAASHDDVHTVTVLVGDGRGGFRAGPAAETTGRGSKIAAADTDRDGRPDLLLGGVGGVHVLLNQGDGRFRPAPGSPVGSGADAWAWAAADLDGDGAADLVVPDRAARGLVVLLGRRPGSRARP